MNLKGLKEKVKNVPEFSDSNYSIAGYVVAALITITGAFLIYEVLSTDALTFKANWNMFKSPLGNLCMIIGFICAILFWGKMGHWSSTPVVKYYDEHGNHVGTKEDMDVMEQGFAKILMPILGHFVLEPIIYGALIYYPIQCVIALVGAIFPYIMTLIVLAIIAGAWLFTREVKIRYRSALLVACGVLFTVAFGWGGYAIMKSGPGSTIQMLADTSGAQNMGDVTANGDVSQQADEQSVGDAQEVAAAPTEEEEVDDQFEGVGEEGLLGSLPNGTTTFEGDMAGFPIEFTITKNDNSGDVSGTYKNVKYGTTMKLDGESLPAMGGDISFYGKDGDTQWVFNLSGNADNISGTAQGGGKEMKIALHKSAAN